MNKIILLYSNIILSAFSEVNIISDVIVPILSTFIGGIFAFLIAWCTIKADKKKAKQEYLDRIKPYLIIENRDMFLQRENRDKVLNVFLEEDIYKNYVKEIHPYFYLTNIGESVIIVDYLKVNGNKSLTKGNVTIKPGDTFSFFNISSSIESLKEWKNIYLGVKDRQYNLYEYNIVFKVEEKNKSINSTKDIVPISIDCTSGIVKSKENIK